MGSLHRDKETGPNDLKSPSILTIHWRHPATNISVCAFSNGFKIGASCIYKVSNCVDGFTRRLVWQMTLKVWLDLILFPSIPASRFHFPFLDSISPSFIKRRFFVEGSRLSRVDFLLVCNLKQSKKRRRKSRRKKEKKKRKEKKGKEKKRTKKKRKEKGKDCKETP